MNIVIPFILAIIGTFLIAFRLGFNYGWRECLFDQLYKQALKMMQKERGDEIGQENKL